MRELCNITYAWQRDEAATVAVVATAGADMMKVWDALDDELHKPFDFETRARGPRAPAPPRARSKNLQQTLTMMGMPTR